MQNRFIIWLFASLSFVVCQSAMAHTGEGVHYFHFNAWLAGTAALLVIIGVCRVFYRSLKSIECTE